MFVVAMGAAGRTLRWGNGMELTTLTLAFLFGLGLLGVDSVMHAGSVEVEVAIAPKVESISIDEQTLAGEDSSALSGCGAGLVPRYGTCVNNRLRRCTAGIKYEKTAAKAAGNHSDLIRFIVDDLTGAD